jgi:predicted kinase
MKPLSLARPHLIIMVGISGAGKSQFAAQFADTFKAPLISRDAVLEQIFIDDKSGVAESDTTANRITTYLLNQLLKTGQTIVFDGASDSRVERLELAKAAKSAGYESLFVWVQTDPTEAKRRAAKQKTRSLTSGDYEAALSRFRVPTASEKVVVISGKHTFASQLKIVLKRLAGEHTEAAAKTIIPPRPNRNIIIR